MVEVVVEKVADLISGNYPHTFNYWINSGFLAESDFIKIYQENCEYNNNTLSNALNLAYALSTYASVSDDRILKDYLVFAETFIRKQFTKTSTS
jgi:hypothetical protein